MCAQPLKILYSNINSESPIAKQILPPLLSTVLVNIFDRAKKAFESLALTRLDYNCSRFASYIIFEFDKKFVSRNANQLRILLLGRV